MTHRERQRDLAFADSLLKHPTTKDGLSPRMGQGVGSSSIHVTHMSRRHPNTSVINVSRKLDGTAAIM